MQSANSTTKQILIVEDYREAAETFKELLEILGHDVQYVMSGADAETIVQQASFDLVFMDLNLPDTTGVELIGRLKEQLGANRPKFAAVTGYAAADSRGTEARSHFDYYLEKPIDLVSLDKLLASF